MVEPPDSLHKVKNQPRKTKGTARRQSDSKSEIATVFINSFNDIHDISNVLLDEKARMIHGFVDMLVDPRQVVGNMDRKSPCLERGQNVGAQGVADHQAVVRPVATHAEYARIGGRRLVGDDLDRMKQPGES